MSNIYKVENYLAPDRATEGDHYDMKIDAIINGLEGRSHSIDAQSSNITTSNTKTYFNKKLVLPPYAITPGKILTVRALFTATSPVGNMTNLTIDLDIAGPGVSPTNLYTTGVFNPPDGTSRYLLEWRAVASEEGLLQQLGDRWYDITTATATAIPPSFADFPYVEDAANYLQLAATFSVSDANTVFLAQFSYTIN